MTYEHFSTYRAGLIHDFAPVNNQERLLIDEVAHSWRRLIEARHRERLFFDLQRHYQAKLNDAGSDQSFQKDGAEVLMWLETPHKAYNQILRSIRDADLAFDRAWRRLDTTIDRRLRRALPCRQRQSDSTHFDRNSSFAPVTLAAAGPVRQNPTDSGQFAAPSDTRSPARSTQSDPQTASPAPMASAGPSGNPPPGTGPSAQSPQHPSHGTHTSPPPTPSGPLTTTRFPQTDYRSGCKSDHKV